MSSTLYIPVRYSETVLTEYLYQQFVRAVELDVDVDLDSTLEGGLYGVDTKDPYRELGFDFFSTIHDLCRKAGLPPSRVTVWWGNVNSYELYEKWVQRNNPAIRLKLVEYYPAWFSLVNLNIQEYINTNTKKEKLFTFFNGYTRPHRLKALNFLNQNNLLEHCEWTWVSDAVDGLDKNLHSVVPKSAEGHTNYLEYSTSKNPGKEFYKMLDATYFDLIAETFYSHEDERNLKYNWWDSVFFSEKIVRSILHKRPFLLIGNKHSLEKLRSMGFKTFPQLFDESYDHMNDNKRLQYVLDQLLNLRIDDLHSKINSNEITNIVEHNYLRLKEIVKFENNENVKRIHTLFVHAEPETIVHNLPASSNQAITWNTVGVT